ncbi:hypothetical protein GCM10027416_12470 [Okibacterium endophyticum]
MTKIRIQSRYSVALVAAMMIVSCATAGPAYADDAPPSVPPEALVVLPSELEDAGASASAVAAQTEFIESLTPAQAAEQDELRESEEALGIDVPDQLIEPMHVPVSDSGGVVTPFAATTGCWPSGQQPYRFYVPEPYSGAGYYCWSGAGKSAFYGAGFGPVRWLSPQSWRGHVMYSQNNTYYWSLWRNASTAKYYFDELPGAVRVHQVELSQYSG